MTGAANSTGRLVAGQLVAKLGGANVALVVPDGQQDSYWPVEMPDDVVLSKGSEISPAHLARCSFPQQKPVSISCAFTHIRAPSWSPPNF